MVDLVSRDVQHYEALVRFADGESPAEMILMAEELDLIENFDLAVAEMAIKTLRLPRSRGADRGKRLRPLVPAAQVPGSPAGAHRQPTCG